MQRIRGDTPRSARAQTLRDHLRAATSQSHDTLDASMRPASDWRSKEDYARFLRSQYAARIPVECWLSTFAPADLKPPEQTPFLARDLINLGEVISSPDYAFDLGYRSEATAIGVAWVLAGSSLGNRAMLGDMQRALGAQTPWPHAFLSSRAMTDFWKRLRARIEHPVSDTEAAQAATAATQVFDHFLGVSREAVLEVAA